MAHREIFHDRSRNENTIMMVRYNNARVHITTFVVTALALTLSAAAPASAAGLPNCNEAEATPCFEPVWVNKVEVNMTFLDLNPIPAEPSDVPFYVLASQTATPQGGPVPFYHDHVTSGKCAKEDEHEEGDGDTDLHYRGYLVFCSADAMASGACVPTLTLTPDGILPFAKTVNGKRLTSSKRIESAASAGLVTLIDTGSVFVAKLQEKRHPKK